MFDNVILIIVVFSAILMIGLMVFLVSLYKKPKEGEVFLISGVRGVRGVRVAFSGDIVIPILEKIELINIKTHQIEVFLEGKAGIVTKDNVIADVKATFSVRVNPEPMSIINAAHSLGSKLTHDSQQVSQLFAPKFEDVIRTVSSQFDFAMIKSQPDKFNMEILNTIGMDLNGFALDDLAMNYLTATAKRLKL